MWPHTAYYDKHASLPTPHSIFRIAHSREVFTMTEDVLKDAEERMKKAIEALRRDLLSIRTGRATPALIERMAVEYYGTPTPLNQLATISAPEPRLLTVQPWDKGALPIIEKALQK